MGSLKNHPVEAASPVGDHGEFSRADGPQIAIGDTTLHLGDAGNQIEAVANPEFTPALRQSSHARISPISEQGEDDHEHHGEGVGSAENLDLLKEI